MQVFEGFGEVPPADWRSVWSQAASANPFNQIEFLVAMERSGSADADSGWQARPVVLYDQATPVAAFPLYLKGHSYGEYVFDWAWARAFEQARMRYYPKWLVASPFSPVPGSRLLCVNAEALTAAAQALTSLSQQSGASSAHLLFGTGDEHLALESLGWLARSGVQFHWLNKGYADFDAFLQALTQPKRKKIKAERRKVREAGVTTEVRAGQEITEELWALFYRCYCQTYHEHGNPPYLTAAFFEEVRQTMSDSFVMAIARDHSGEPIASALLMRDAQHQVLFGRYWGAVAHVPCLHFELAYYTPLEWAIGQGMARVEGGAQGEHKMARGFEPVATGSVHWISQPQFRDAVARFLEQETEGVDDYLSELDDRRPFRPPQAADGETTAP